jgi:hypothetical protein
MPDRMDARRGSGKMVGPHGNNRMQTGDKVLAILAAKIACCGLLVLAAAGLLGGLGAWLAEGSGPWLIGGAVLASIVWAVFGRR